jgi:hypothetical protein
MWNYLPLENQIEKKDSGIDCGSMFPMDHISRSVKCIWLLKTRQGLESNRTTTDPFKRIAQQQFFEAL